MATETPVSIRLSAELLNRIDSLSERDDRTRSSMIVRLLRNATEIEKPMMVLRELTQRWNSVYSGEEKDKFAEEIYLVQHVVRQILGDTIYIEIMDSLGSEEISMPTRPWL